jgi:16S rRNA G527 N7-methylase RsmG
MRDTPDALDDLIDALAEQQRLGVLGTSPVDAIEHSDRFLPALPLSGRVLDLGSGAGVPGLVIAVRRPALRVTLLDSRSRRTDQLMRIVLRLGLIDRVEVVCARAEDAGQRVDLAGLFQAVTARAFGSPVAVLTSARPFLVSGGRLIVSEPPVGGGRWGADVLQRARFRVLAPAEIPRGMFVAEAV